MIDPAAVIAIDVHVHTELTRDGHDPMPPELRAAARRYFKSDQELPTVDDVAEYYRERNLAAVGRARSVSENQKCAAPTHSAF